MSRDTLAATRHIHQRRTRCLYDTIAKTHFVAFLAAIGIRRLNSRSSAQELLHRASWSRDPGIVYRALWLAKEREKERRRNWRKEIHFTRVKHVILIVIDGETATVEKNKRLPSRPTGRQHREGGYRKAQSERGEEGRKKKGHNALFRNISRLPFVRRPLIGRDVSRGHRI